MLAKILKSGAAGELEEAEVQIATAGRLFLGFDVGLILNLSEESALALVRQRDDGDAGAYVVAAELFREQGDLLELKAGANAGHDSYVKSLNMYERMLSSLLRYFETTGEYARAEDVLFRRIGDGDPDLVEHADLVERGIGFYLRLLLKPDQELVEGGLPRDEVEEGLETLRGMRAR
ncbi:MAG: hypothetical protein KKA32_18055 [Actinobacteria bacterium]|nr:hypothetical protein [Actinomycetota bacterium]